MSVSLQLPILFDISAGAQVFGEDVSGVDIFDAHLKFELVTTGANNPATEIRKQFRNILYADATEDDVSGVLFYLDNGTTGSGVGSSIQSAILNGKIKQAGTATYSEAAGTAGDAASVPNNDGTWTARYQTPGIPLPNYGVTAAATTGDATGQAYYTDALCDSGGTTFGRVLVRLMATSLMGHPFAQGFIKNEQGIIEDISNCDIGSQIDNKLFKGPKKGEAPDATTAISVLDTAIGENNEFNANATAAKADGIHNHILQQIYEQLLGSQPNRFDASGTTITGDDAENLADNDNVNCQPHRLPILANDTISFYFRPRVALTIDADTSSGVEAGTVDDGDDTTVSGEGDVNSSVPQTAKRLDSIFFQPRHRWISYPNGTTLPASDKDDDGNVQMKGTNLISGADGTIYFDAHVWRVLCKIPSA